ncbi:sensor histidine kinase [Bacillus sp. JJ1764]|uniref:sensor histidine kinase n=1 Tax=Bacillus sp. JJ1764 TaxID=3122964 RepID=UPI002FFEB242
MEFWIILTKLVLMLYISILGAQSHHAHMAWMVFAMLLYFCINITFHIIRKTMIQTIVLVLSGSLIIMAYLSIYSIFIILLPLTLLEISAHFTNKRFLIFAVSFFPIIYLGKELQPLYGMVAILSFMVLSMIATYGERITKDEQQIDQLRKSLQKLTKDLNDHNEFIKQSEYTFKLEERNRISQEIHDNIGHTMTGALFQMEAAKRVMDSNQQKAVELLQNAINISKDGIESIRLTLKNLKPPTEQVGIHRIKLLMDEFSAKHLIKTALTYDGNLDIVAPIQWKIIQENATEALTNAAKYSNATLISVDMKVLNKIIRVEVRDNGSGAEKVKKGLGIIGMEERTAAVNGKVIVDSSNGFSVTTLIPISS